MILNVYSINIDIWSLTYSSNTFFKTFPNHQFFINHTFYFAHTQNIFLFFHKHVLSFIFQNSKTFILHNLITHLQIWFVFRKPYVSYFFVNSIIQICTNQYVHNNVNVVLIPNIYILFCFQIRNINLLIKIGLTLCFTNIIRHGEVSLFLLLWNI